MNNIPTGAEYYYQHTYYQFGKCYARYYANSTWRESASVTNEELALEAVEIKK